MPKIQFFNAGMYRGKTLSREYQILDGAECLLGLGVSMARSCLINMIFFSSFEFVKKRINILKDPDFENPID